MPSHLSVRGVDVPDFMYGTAWKEDRTPDLTRMAIEAGFRAIDTANQRRHYVEAGVGEAIRTTPRDQLFLQTKFTYARGQDHRLPYDPRASWGDQVTQSFASSLEHLGTDYIDSFVLHGPAGPHGLQSADREVWAAMEELAHDGRARLLGVSNVTVEQLELLHHGATVKPAFVQNRCYARMGWDAEVRAFCRRHDMIYQGFSLLTANARELARPAVLRIAERLEATVPQVVFRFAQAQGMLPLTGTSDRAHMAEDLASRELALTPEDLDTLHHAAAP